MKASSSCQRIKKQRTEKREAVGRAKVGSVKFQRTEKREAVGRAKVGSVKFQ